MNSRNLLVRLKRSRRALLLLGAISVGLVFLMAQWMSPESEFSNVLPSTLTWHKELVLAMQVSNSSTAVMNAPSGEQYIYVIGGRNQSGELSGDVYGTRLIPGEGIDRWRTEKFPETSIQFHAIAVLNDKIYLIGGNDGVNSLTSVFFAQIGDWGEIGSWKETSSLPEPVYLHTAVELGGRVYVIGGYNNFSGRALETVNSASIEPDGEILAWVQEKSLDKSLTAHAAVASDEHKKIYVVGGWTGETEGRGLKDVLCANIEPEGPIANWQKCAELPLVPEGAEGLLYHSAVIYDDKIYVIGGELVFKDARDISRAVYVASLDHDGNITKWRTLKNSLPEPLAHLGNVVSRNGEIYLIGGMSSAASYSDSVYRSSPITPSQWPWQLSLVMALFLGTSSLALYSLYAQLPSTQARRAKRWYQQYLQASFLDGLYQLLDKGVEPGVAHRLRDAVERERNSDYARVFSAFHSVVEQTEISESLCELSVTLGSSVSPQWGESLKMLYGFLASAHRVQSVNEVAQLKMMVVNNGAVERLPEFMQPVALKNLLRHLGETVDLLEKEEEPQALEDKRVYLQEALKAIGRVLRLAKDLARPEKIITVAIANRWRQIVIQERKYFDVRATVDLKSPVRRLFVPDHPMPGHEIHIPLTVHNNGLGTARNICLELERLNPAEEYQLKGRRTQELPGDLSGGERYPLSFSVALCAPRRTPALALDFCLRWDDDERRGKSVSGPVVVAVESIEKFTSFTNPYEAGLPITNPVKFFGRKEIIDRIIDSLKHSEQKVSILLIGQRRTGKTSILKQLETYLLPDEYISVFIDMQDLPGVGSTTEFLARVAQDIYKAVERRGFALASPAIKGDSAAAFSGFLDEVETVIGHCQVMLMFDEFELILKKLSREEQDKCLPYLRHQMQFRSSIVFMFVGASFLRDIASDYFSILFGSVLQQEICYLDPESTRLLITELTKGYLEYDDLAVEKIVRATHCQPYLVQLACWETVQLLNRERQHRVIVFDDVERSLERMLLTAEGYFDHFWRGSEPLERVILTMLAEQPAEGDQCLTLREIESILQEWRIQVDRSEIVKALRNLRARNLLEECEGGLRYMYQIELVKMWIRKHKRLRSVFVEELGAFEIRS